MKHWLIAICILIGGIASYYFGSMHSETNIQVNTEAPLLNDVSNVEKTEPETPMTANRVKVKPKKQVVEVTTEASPKQLQKIAAIKPEWMKRFPMAKMKDQKVFSTNRKVGIKRNVNVLIRENLIVTDLKYPNLISEEIYTEDENGEFKLSSYVEYVADHILVNISNEEKLHKLKEEFNSLGFKKIADKQLFIVSLNGSDIDTVKNAIADYESDGSIKYAEKDYVLNKSTNDTHFSHLYGLHNIGQSGGTVDADIDAPEAWGITKGSRDVLVAIIDTGIDYNHEDLAANMWQNPGETGTDANGNDKSTNGIDDDNNGFIDDFRGWDFVNDDNDPIDDNAHGTHCAGTIGAVGDNSTGVIGVSPLVSMVGLKFLSGSGSGFISDAVQAVLYTNKIGVDISSNSWGGGGFSQSLKNAIEESANRNIVFVAAAGNSGRNTDDQAAFPASYDCANIISVAATDRNDALASFSNFGVTSVDMGAPGVSILSTVPGNSYSFFSGTSMACPHVSGAAALLRSTNSSISFTDIKNALMHKSDFIGSLSGKTASGSRLNIHKALSTENSIEPAVITSPVNGSEFTGSEVTFEWTTNDGIDGITISIGTSVGASDLHFNDNLGNATSVTVTLPEDGSRIFVRLSSLIDGETIHRDSSYIASNKDIPPPAKSELTAPVAGTVLKSGIVNFEWTQGSQVERRYLYVGTSKGYCNLFCGYVGDSGISLDLSFFTEKTYVRLWSRIEGCWKYVDYEFDSEVSISAMVSPADGSKLTSSNVTFEWTEGYNINYRYLMVGSRPGYSNLFRSYVYGTSRTVSVPTDGSTIYVRLWSYIPGGGWKYRDYSYKTALLAPEISEIDSHKEGSIFDSENVTLTWTEGVSVRYNYLYIYSNTNFSRVFSGMVYNNETTINIPESSGQITAYLYSYINGSWKRASYIFYAKGSAPAITSPVSGSQLYSNSVTFKWNRPSNVYYNYMMVGTRPGGSNLYSKFLINTDSHSVNINATGKIYVRLWTYNGRWTYSDSVFTK